MRPEHWLYTIPLRLRSLFRWAQADQELDDELRHHLERKTEEYLAQGMTQEEAHRRARLDLEGIEQTKEKCRDARRVNWIQDLIQDLHFGLRVLRKSPGFTAVAVLTLAIGIGANTAIFSLVDQLVLRLLPVQDPQTVVALSEVGNFYGDSQYQGETSPMSYPKYQDIRGHNQVFAEMMCQRQQDFTVSISSEAEAVRGELVRFWAFNRHWDGCLRARIRLTWALILLWSLAIRTG